MSRTLEERLLALREAVQLAEGRLDPELVEQARAVTTKAGARVGHGLERTVVALAGPTGVGKSLLFNVLTENQFASVSRRRPTTSTTQAAAWGEGADPLLDWLEVRARHRLAGDGLDGLVLLDLPDFDSTASAHRAEVERIIALADLVLWVVEPQKYADASLHERYLRPLATHAAAMALVLNQADLLAPADTGLWREDAQRLLASDGLREVPIVVLSAQTGQGIADLRRLLEERVAARTAAVLRLGADVQAAVAPLAAACGGRTGGVRGQDRQRLIAALEDAAGVPTIIQAVGAAHRRRGALATGWPFVRWLRRFRPDPLRRLRLPDSPEPAVRTSLPPPTEVQRAQIATAARRLGDGVAADLPPPWPTLVRRAATAGEEQVADRLDRAMAAADLHVARPRWWSGAALLQRALAAAVVVGLLWLLALALLGYLRAEEIVPLPELRGVPVPSWLVLGGAAAGLALAFLTRLANGTSARRRARAAARSLRRQVAAVAEELVIEPVEKEVEAHAQLCSALAIAGDNPRRRPPQLRSEAADPTAPWRQAARR